MYAGLDQQSTALPQFPDVSIRVQECLRRLQQSKETGEKNFYFLTIDANECIDAHKKGNLARFINHR